MLKKLDARTWGYALIVAAAAFTAAYATLLLTRASHGIAVLWISNAIILSAILVRRDSAVPLMIVGPLATSIANLLVGNDLPTTIGFLGANAVDILLGFWLMSRLGTERFTPGSLDFLARFVPVSGLAAPAASATVGAAVAHAAFGSPFWHLWLAWFISCSLGAIIVVPLLVSTWKSHSAPKLRLKASEEQRALAVLAAVAVVNLVVFGGLEHSVLFIPMAAVVLATVIFGHQLASRGIAVCGLSACASLFTQTGPLMMYDSLDARILMLQAFLAVLSLTCLPIAAVLYNKQLLRDRLADAEAHRRLLMESADDAILHVDRAGTVLHASHAVLNLTGLPPEAIIGRPGVEFVHADDVRTVAQAHYGVVASGGAATIRYRFEHKRTREQRWLEARTRAIFAAGEVTGVVTTVRDITDIVANEVTLENEAATDQLTGLPNRRVFMSRLDQVLKADPHHTAVAILDIDLFKRFNDQHGHAAGDAVLRAVGQAAKSALREGDLVARLGGEEFAILLPRTSVNDALAVAERVRGAIEACKLIYEGRHLRVTASIGAAVSSPATCDSASLLSAADAFLYTAKGRGRNQVCLAA